MISVLWGRHSQRLEFPVCIFSVSPPKTGNQMIHKKSLSANHKIMCALRDLASRVFVWTHICPAYLANWQRLRIEAPNPPKIPKYQKNTTFTQTFLKSSDANFCPLPCDTSQEPNGNSSENLFRWTFYFWWIFFFRVDFLLWVERISDSKRSEHMAAWELILLAFEHFVHLARKTTSMSIIQTKRGLVSFTPKVRWTGSALRHFAASFVSSHKWHFLPIRIANRNRNQVARFGAVSSQGNLPQQRP